MSSTCATRTSTTGTLIPSQPMNPDLSTESASDVIAAAFGVTGGPLTWAFTDVFNVVVSRHLVADHRGRLPEAYVQILLTLAEHHPVAEIRVEAAKVLPPEHWRTALRVLAAAPGHRMHDFVSNMPFCANAGYEEDRADEVFDFVWDLAVSARSYTNDRDLTWLPADTPAHIRHWWRDLRLRSDQILPTVRSIGYALRDAAERATPERGARFVADHAHDPLAHTAIGRLIEHVVDPATFETLFDIRNTVAPWHALPLYMWRRDCLRARAVPTHLANRQILDSGATSLGDDFPHVVTEPLREATYLARLAAIKADPALVAALILADPHRWWAQLTRADVSNAKPRGNYARLNSRTVHIELAAIIRSLSTDASLLTDPRDTHSAHALATREPLRDRLVWLVDKASGPGFETVVSACADIPDVKVRRRAAKHPQIPGDTVSALTADPDARVRTNAQAAFTRALSAL